MQRHVSDEIQQSHFFKYINLAKKCMSILPTLSSYAEPIANFHNSRVLLINIPLKELPG
jgi:hypothetical protein